MYWILFIQKVTNFTPAMIYLVTKTLNRIENFKMFKDKYGYLCAWDKIIPNYTIFHNDDHTLSDCWTDFSEDFDTFYPNILKDMATAATKKGIVPKEGQPTIFTVYLARHGQHLPVMAESLMANLLFFPNCTWESIRHGGKMLMPVNITIAHAVADDIMWDYSFNISRKNDNY